MKPHIKKYKDFVENDTLGVFDFNAFKNLQLPYETKSFISFTYGLTVTDGLEHSSIPSVIIHFHLRENFVISQYLPEHYNEKNMLEFIINFLKECLNNIETNNSLFKLLETKK